MIRAAVGVTVLLAAGVVRAEDVEGVVRDSDGEPMAGAEVTAGGQTAWTDDAGRYRIRGLLPGRYTVRVDGSPERTVEVRADGVAVVDFRIDRGLIEHGVRIGSDADSALGVVPGSQGDALGVGFGGSDSLENRYVVEGLDVTGVEYPTESWLLPLELVSEIDVITAGAGAAHGRFTGGLVRVSAKRGSDRVRGSVFGWIAPAALRAAQERGPVSRSSIDTESSVDSLIAGAEIGGPIVPRHAWYWFAIVPRSTTTHVTRITRRRSDCREVIGGELSIPADEPCTGTPMADWVRDGVPDVDPATGFEIYEDVDRRQYDLGLHGATFLGRIDATVSPEQQGGVFLHVTPTSQRWTNPIGNVDDQWFVENAVTTDVSARWTSRFDATVVAASVGMHRSTYRRSSAVGNDDEPQRSIVFADGWAASGGESEITRAACDDASTDDPYPDIVNCPLNASYTVGGPGALADDVEQRRTAALAISRQFGAHTAQLGGDVERQELVKARRYSGGYTVTQLFSSSFQLTRWLDDADETHESDSSAVFVEDVWQVLPEVAMEAGLRYDRQSIDDQLTLDDMLSPRLGVAYTDAGARAFGHYGRYYEALPMRIAMRAFETTGFEIIADDCEPDGTGCDPDDPTGDRTIYEPTPTAVDPELRGQYIDEIVLGAERAIAHGARVGVTFLHRSLGAVIEDVSDDASEYLITNPDARREYDALTFQLSGSLSRSIVLHASYTFARTRGDYPGLYSPDNGQLDPNLSTQFDLDELGANRGGPLPQDRPHYLKLDGYYDLGALTLGGRVRALSGTPIDVTAGHYRYGIGESHLLPRGAGGRAPATYGVDLHADYTHELRPGVSLTLFVDVLNVNDHQAAYEVDEDYTYLSEANPIVGGSYEDLIWAKEQSSTGGETTTPIRRNPNFGKTSSRYSPRSMRLGARLTF